jgi:hypothetical protein
MIPTKILDSLNTLLSPLQRPCNDVPAHPLNPLILLNSLRNLLKSPAPLHLRAPPGDESPGYFQMSLRDFNSLSQSLFAEISEGITQPWPVVKPRSGRHHRNAFPKNRPRPKRHS